MSVEPSAAFTISDAPSLNGVTVDVPLAGLTLSSSAKLCSWF